MNRAGVTRPKPRPRRPRMPFCSCRINDRSNLTDRGLLKPCVARGIHGWPFDCRHIGQDDSIQDPLREFLHARFEKAVASHGIQASREICQSLVSIARDSDRFRHAETSGQDIRVECHSGFERPVRVGRGLERLASGRMQEKAHRVECLVGVRASQPGRQHAVAIDPVRNRCRHSWPYLFKGGVLDGDQGFDNAMVFVTGSAHADRPHEPGMVVAHVRGRFHLDQVAGFQDPVRVATVEVKRAFTG